MPKIPPPKPSNIPTTVRKPQLWAVIIGVNRYQDADIDDLNFCANDAVGLAAALHEVALQQAANRQAIFDTVEIRVHCDRSNASSVNSISFPTVSNILASLDLFSQAQPQDTVLFYFSGHGFHDRSTENTILCLPTTEKNALSQTGLAIADVVKAITSSPAKQQLIWLDACHSGGMASQLIDAILAATKENPQIYAITACDRDEESLEFLQLGHGLFTYNLIQGLQGGITNPVIKAEELYQYVYYKTLEYIDRTNQLSQLIGGYSSLTSFTPQRFAFGSGEFKLGLPSSPSDETKRGALVIDGVNPSPMALKLSNSLANKGKFFYQPYSNCDESIKDSIAALLDSPNTIATLLYLKGNFEVTDDLGIFQFDDGSIISQEWLARQIANSPCPQQVIIFDCNQTANIKEQIEIFKQPNKSQCIVAASTEDNWLGQKLIDIIDRNSAEGLTATNLIARCSKALAKKGIFKPKQRSFYRSPQMEIIDVVYPQEKQTNNIVIDRNYCPYKGLEAFTPKDKDYFFGRENLIREIIAQLETSSFLPIVGASGSGKSSVIQAGIVPILLKQGIFNSEDSLYHPCQVWTLRPGEDPLRALALALSDRKDPPKSPLFKGDLKELYTCEYLEGILNLGIPSFVAWLRQQPQPMGVLIVDQFEELFTQASEVRRSLFIDLILGAVRRASDRFKVIITLRSDFMASCLSLTQLGEKVKQNPIFVPSYLTETESQQIITQPAKRVGLSVQPELVDVLISEVSQEKGALPLLEFTLEQLWLNRDAGNLSLKIYQEKIGGIKKVLQERADAIYQKLTQPQQECAEWIFTQLVSLGEGQEDTRRRRNLSELIVPKYPQELITSTLNILRDSRLIVTSDRDGDIITSQQAQAKTKGANKEEKSESLQLSIDSEMTVEIAHEILIRNWQQLRWWLDENREQIRLRERIEAKATEWKINGEKIDYLIRGAALAQAEEFYIKSAGELSEKTQEFITGCIEERDREAKLAKQRQQQLISSSINALNYSAKALLAFNQELDALITGLKAARNIIDNSWLEINQETKFSTLSILQNTFYRVKEFNRLESHTGTVNRLAFSPDGEIIASASWDKTIKLWSRQGTLLTTLKGHTDNVQDVAFSPDGEIIASASRDETIRLWSKQGILLATLEGHTLSISHLLFSPDGEIVASVSSDGTIKLWSRQGTLLTTLEGHTGSVNDVAFSPDGEIIASASWDKTIKLWSRQGTLLATVEDHTGSVVDVAFSPDGEIIASASRDKTIKLWSRQGSLLTTLEGHTRSFAALIQPASSVAFSPDGEIIASASQDKTIKLWSKQGTLLATLEGHHDDVHGVAFSPDGEIIASASRDKTIRLWSRQGSLLVTLKGHSDVVSQVAFSPDGEIIASASWDKTIKLWSRRRTLLSTFKNHPDNVIKDRTDNVTKLLKYHAYNFTDVAFSPDDQIIAFASQDKTIKLWSRQGTLLATLEGHSGVVSQVAFSPDGEIIASVSRDETIKLWSKQGTLLATLEGHTVLLSNLIVSIPVSYVAFSPDSEIIASAGRDKTIKLWSRQGTLLTTLKGHPDVIVHVVFSPDGEIIASASSDKTIKLWSRQGTLLATLEGHTDDVNRVVFSPDGRTLFSASRDKTIKIWSLDLDDVLARGCDWVKDYLTNNPNVSEEDKKICEGIE